MRLILVESPYAGDIARNERYLRRAMFDELQRGNAPFAGHAIYPLVLNEEDPDDRRLGILAGYFCAISQMKKADAAHFYVDYGWSPGMLAARGIAELLELPCEERKIGHNPPPGNRA